MFTLMSFGKTLLLTLVVVILLQIKVGNLTVEQHTIDWYRTSSLTAPIQDVANGGGRIVRDISNKIVSGLKIDLFRKVEDHPGRRDLGLRLKRSQEYLREKTRAAAQKIQDELEDEQPVYEYQAEPEEERRERR